MTVKQIETPSLDSFTLGVFLGLLIGEGHFGGDGKQPHITLRMHTRHENLFKWLAHTFPGSKLYGPYTHGGRSYYQWMARGDVLRRVAPLLNRTTLRYLDPYQYARFARMASDDGIDIA